MTADNMKIAVFYENIKTGAEASCISTEEALRRLRAEGMGLIYADYNTMNEDLPWLAPIMEKIGIGVEGLYGFFDFAHDPGDCRYKDCIDLCKKLGAKNALPVPGFVLPDEEDKAEVLIDNMQAGLEAMVRYGKAQEIPVTLEDYDAMTAPYSCISGVKWFMENVQGLKCAFDTGNFAIAGEDELEAFNELKDRIVTIHIKDRSKARLHPGDKHKICVDGSAVYPCAIGNGYIRIPEIIAELKAIRYDGSLIIEMFDCEASSTMEGLAESIRYLKALI